MAVLSFNHPNTCCFLGSYGGRQRYRCAGLWRATVAHNWASQPHPTTDKRDFAVALCLKLRIVVARQRIYLSVAGAAWGWYACRNVCDDGAGRSRLSNASGDAAAAWGCRANEHCSIWCRRSSDSGSRGCGRPWKEHAVKYVCHAVVGHHICFDQVGFAARSPDFPPLLHFGELDIAACGRHDQAVGEGA